MVTNIDSLSETTLATMPARTGSYNDVSELVVEVMKIFGIAECWSRN